MSVYARECSFACIQRAKVIEKSLRVYARARVCVCMCVAEEVWEICESGRFDENFSSSLRFSSVLVVKSPRSCDRWIVRYSVSTRVKTYVYRVNRTKDVNRKAQEYWRRGTKRRVNSCALRSNDRLTASGLKIFLDYVGRMRWTRRIDNKMRPI